MRQIALLLFFLASRTLAGDILQFCVADRAAHQGWRTNSLNGETIWISPTPELTSVHVASAELEWPKSTLSADAIERLKKLAPNATINTNHQPCISITFTEQGQAIFTQVTTAHQGALLAIVSDNKVLSAPKIMEPITGGRAQIAGNFTEAEAKALIDKLNTKAGSNQPSEGTR